MDINTTSTTNPNPHFMTKPQPFYYGEQMKKWANTPMSYAMDIAIENHFSDVLEFPLDRIIYASNEYCFRERTRRNKGELNLPFLNYYRVGFEDADRPWKNDYSNRFGLIDRENNFTSKLGGVMRIYPITISYEGTAFFAQNKDCEYAMNKLLFDNSNETIVKPQVETNDGDIITNAGLMDFDIEYNPTYQESDWLEQNRIWTIGIDFTITTYMIGNFNTNPSGEYDSEGNPLGIKVAKNVLLEFFTAKKLNYENYKDSEQMEMFLTEYFGETN